VPAAAQLPADAHDTEVTPANQLFSTDLPGTPMAARQPFTTVTTDGGWWLLLSV
jgi:hypothetical protein